MRYALNTVPINGNETIHMMGTAAMALDASGLTNKQRPFTASIASMVFGASATMVHGKALAGSAAIVLGASAYLKHTTPLRSDPAAMVMGLGWSIPHPKTIPAQFNPSHISRIGRIRDEWRDAEVPTNDRHRDVPPEPRTGFVTSERTK